MLVNIFAVLILSTPTVLQIAITAVTINNTIVRSNALFDYIRDENFYSLSQDIKDAEAASTYNIHLRLLLSF